jgi:hypothetical protein
MSRVEDPSDDLEDLYNDTSKILKRLTGEKDSAPALEEYYQYPGLTDEQIGAVKWTKEKYGGVQACRKAGEFVEKDRRASIEQLLKGEEDSDRNKLLDALAEAPAEAVALWEQARMRALLELRFGIKFSGDSPLDTGHQKGLDRLYRVLKDVPAKHLKLLQEKGGIELDYADEGFRGDYVRKTKTVAIAMPLSDHKEVQRPNSAGEAATVQWFKQVATHEVGHAVDDADEYMSKHQKEADHGAWEKSDIHTAVAAYAAALQKQLGAEISKIGVGDGSTVYDLQKFIAYSILRSPPAENEVHVNSEAARKTAADSLG